MVFCVIEECSKPLFSLVCYLCLWMPVHEYSMHMYNITFLSCVYFFFARLSIVFSTKKKRKVKKERKDLDLLNYPGTYFIYNVLISEYLLRCFALKNTAFFHFLNFVFHILPFLFTQYLLKYILVSSSVFLCG